MKIKLPKRTINVWIRHDRPDLGREDVDEGNFTDHRSIVREICPSTHCTIDLNNGMAPVQGSAYCDTLDGDVFVKRRGVALAVKRALAETLLNREERTVVYDTLFGRSKQSKAELEIAADYAELVRGQKSAF